MTVTSEDNNRNLTIFIFTQVMDVSGWTLDKERIKIPVSLNTRASQSEGIFT